MAKYKISMVIETTSWFEDDMDSGLSVEDNIMQTLDSNIDGLDVEYSSFKCKKLED